MKKLYSVKLVNKAIISGEPIAERIDKYYNKDTSFYEECLYLVQAKDDQNAFDVAEKIALKELGEPYINQYGQKVERKLIGFIDCYCLFNKPSKDFPEVYSRYFIASSQTTDAQFIKEKYDHILDDFDANEQYQQIQTDKQCVLRNEEFSRLAKNKQ